MVAPGPTDMHDETGQLRWLAQATESFRLRGYLTMRVRIGYELVLIVSGPTGEAAVIDLSGEARAHWQDVWDGMRQVLPRMPVVAVIPEGEDHDDHTSDYQAPVIRIPDPPDPNQIVEAVERLLQAPPLR